MFRWFKQLLCSHQWESITYNEGYYDQEFWWKCRKCGKEKD